MNHQEWLEERRKGIGGSDAAAIVGLNPYASPYTVWADKMGRLPEKEDNEAMRQGRDLEGYVAERWMEVTGKKCRRRTKMLRHPDYPYAHANVDRWVVGENAGLECKTTSIMNLKKFKTGEYPETYYCQCIHYMAVTGAERWYLAVLILNQGFYTFVIERDEDEITALMEAEKQFWQFVETDSPPPVDGMKATSDAINTIYANSKPDKIDLFGMDTLVEVYIQLKKERQQINREIKCIENRLKTELGEAEIGNSKNYTVSWKKSQRVVIPKEVLLSKISQKNLAKIATIKKYRRFSIRSLED